MKLDYTPSHGEFFVCLNDDFSNLRTYYASQDDGNLYAILLGHVTKESAPYYHKVHLSELSGPYFPSIQAHLVRSFEKPVEQSIVDLYSLVQSSIDTLLHNRHPSELEIDETIETIASESAISKGSILLVLKVFIAEKTWYKYEFRNKKHYIKSSSLKKELDNSKKYYSSLAEEIAIKSKQIDLLVSHGQTVGNYREHILRSLLKKYLPEKFKVATGFIEGVSRQIDILVIDSHNYPPVFAEGDLVVARQESVRAIIEVKTKLDSKTLDESLDLLYDSTRGGIFKPTFPVFKGIYSFESSYKETSTLVNRVKRFYREPYYDKKIDSKFTRQIDYLYRQVTCICTLCKHFLYSGYENFNGDPLNHSVPCLKSVSDDKELDIQTAMFLASLFRHLDVDFYSKKTTLKGFSKLLYASTITVKHEGYLADADWLPSLAQDNEHDFTKESVHRRLDYLRQWFDGEITNYDYINTLDVEVE